MSFQQQTFVTRKKESLWGILSSVVALVSLACFIVFLLLATYIETATPGGMDEASALAIIFGILILLIFIANLFGAVFGFIGVFQTSKKKVFPVIGAFLNLIILFGLIGIILFGVLVG